MSGSPDASERECSFLIFGLLAIFFGRVLDVSCNTIRILFLVKGQRFIAACIGFMEVMIYMTILGYILGGGKQLSFPELLAYCGGFASGNYVGSWLEEKLMNTFILIEVILEENERSAELIAEAREQGLGATVLRCEGRKGPRLLVKVFCRRHDVRSVQSLFGEAGFISLSDVRRCTGGHFPG